MKGLFGKLSFSIILTRRVGMYIFVCGFNFRRATYVYCIIYEMIVYFVLSEDEVSLTGRVPISHCVCPTDRDSLSSRLGLESESELEDEVEVEIQIDRS